MPSKAQRRKGKGKQRSSARQNNTARPHHRGSAVRIVELDDDDGEPCRFEPAPAAVVQVKDAGFAPRSVQIERGQRVEWHYASSSDGEPAAPSKRLPGVRCDGVFECDTLDKGLFAFEFAERGKYEVVNTLRPGVAHTVEVVAADGDCYSLSDSSFADSDDHFSDGDLSFHQLVRVYVDDDSSFASSTDDELDRRRASVRESRTEPSVVDGRGAEDATTLLATETLGEDDRDDGETTCGLVADDDGDDDAPREDDADDETKEAQDEAQEVAEHQNAPLLPEVTPKVDSSSVAEPPRANAADDDADDEKTKDTATTEKKIEESKRGSEKRREAREARRLRSHLRRAAGIVAAACAADAAVLLDAIAADGPSEDGGVPESKDVPPPPPSSPPGRVPSEAKTSRSARHRDKKRLRKQQRPVPTEVPSTSLPDEQRSVLHETHDDEPADERDVPAFDAERAERRLRERWSAIARCLDGNGLDTLPSGRKVRILVRCRW